ncbi:phosphatase PAP2 family protein [Paraconexibacter sp.]|uniref:phosphatase PAP2 family protein n=1 Tax=Paraconexibacter sp. TaxID=2949640 RepID=UPI003568C424
MSSAIRAAAWGIAAAGIAAPLARRRLRLPPPVVTTAAAAAPFAICVAFPRSRRRDVATCALQMWAYIATYEMPADDPERQRERVRISYPVKIDRVLGLGELPGVRLQRRLGRPGTVRGAEQVLVWAHWLWFLVPHGTVLYLLLRRPERFPSGAASMYGVFDLGLIGYWALPTAPPWYAAQNGHAPELRRMMVEHGEVFWKDGWEPMYGFLGGNPLAAMPSLHFATSVMAAHLLTDTGPLQGALGWSYAVTLGFGLVYLGEHYVVDLIAGLALAEGVRRVGPRAAPLLRGVSRGVQRLESAARA